ncbi:MAG: lipoyl synthase [Verrucomicrobia bacterium]|nr:lipoyl synthase [Verrucomicrobiota bacterium]
MAADSLVSHSRKPPWLKVRIPGGQAHIAVRRRVVEGRLHTVCESARCPNLGECWGRGTATFMILGDVCTRSCGFCAVHTGRPDEVDQDEPARVAEAIRLMGLNHAVITSVARDELADGGASVWAATIRAARQAALQCRIEALIPDFKGDETSLQTVLDANPDLLGHNVETVPRLYKKVRPQAKYDRTLQLLARAKARGFFTKSGLMLGIGEEPSEIEEVLRDLRAAGVDVMTLGQYLRPTAAHLPVARYLTPEEFAGWKSHGLAMGFKAVEAGPLVRSSYHAEEQAAFLTENRGAAATKGPEQPQKGARCTNIRDSVL